MEDFLSELREEEEPLDGNVSELRKRVEGRIESLETERSVMLTSPPWGEGKTPTMTESEVKARQLIEMIADAGDEAPADGASVGALIQAAELALENRSAEQESTLIIAMGGRHRATRRAAARNRGHRPALGEHRASLRGVITIVGIVDRKAWN